MGSQDAEVGMKCITYMLVTTNVLFAMIGFLLVSVGSTIIAIYNDFEMFMEDHYFSPAALLIAIGIIIFLVSLFGCVGAVKKSTFLVNIFAVLLIVILILEISAAIAAYAMRTDIYDYTNDKMRESMDEYKDNNYVQDSWDFMQDRLECCGISGPQDWKQYFPETDVPASCRLGGVSNSPYQPGCLNRLNDIIYDCATLIGTGGICVAIVQVLGVIFAFMLAKSIRRLKTEALIQRQENLAFYAQLARGNMEKPTPVLYTAGESDA